MRIHSRNAAVYLNVASGGNATPVPWSNTWSLKAATDTAEVTAFGDANKTYVSGLPDMQGDFSFFYDDTTPQTFAAAVDGVARKMYLYPDRVNSESKYFYGYVIVDFSADGDVAGATKGSASWKASGNISKSW